MRPKDGEAGSRPHEDPTDSKVEPKVDTTRTERTKERAWREALLPRGSAQGKQDCPAGASMTMTSQEKPPEATTLFTNCTRGAVRRV